MKLSDAKSFITRFGWIIAVVVFVSLSTMLIFLRFTAKPEKQPSLPKLTIQPIGLSTNTFQTQDLQLPSSYQKTIPVYNLKSENISTLTPTIAAKLGFTSRPTAVNDVDLGQGQVYSNTTGSLVVFPAELTYIRHSENSQAGAFQDPANLKNSAINFVSSLGLPANFADTFDFKYYKSKEEFQKETSPTEANQIKIFLKYQIDDKPAVKANSEVSAVFNLQGDLLELIYHPLTRGSLFGTYPLIPPKDALASLLSGKGVPLKINQSSNLNPPPTQLNSVKLQKAYIAYYQTVGEEILQPVWVFQGISSESQGQNDSLEIFYAVPAIELK